MARVEDPQHRPATCPHNALLDAVEMSSPRLQRGGERAVSCEGIPGSVSKRRPSVTASYTSHALLQQVLGARWLMLMNDDGWCGLYGEDLLLSTPSRQWLGDAGRPPAMTGEKPLQSSSHSLGLALLAVTAVTFRLFPCQQSLLRLCHTS